jgi:FkbM family methyltransferase
MSDLPALVRRLAALPLLGRLAGFPPVLRLSFALRAPLVAERLRFACNELRLSAVTATYRIRDTGVAVTLRHHTPDILVLDEVFSQHEYAFPVEIERVLAGRNSLRVVDLGANIGLFGAWLRGLFPTVQIVAIEADPSNAAVHALTIAANADRDSWKLVEAYASASDGERVRFAGDSFATSRRARDGERAIDVPAVDAFSFLADADLVKMDIEGGEWHILADRRFDDLPATAIVLEYHSELCPAEDPGAAATEALRRAGYEVRPGHAKPQFGAGLLWGWRLEGAQAGT